MINFGFRLGALMLLSLTTWANYRYIPPQKQVCRVGSLKGKFLWQYADQSPSQWYLVDSFNPQLLEKISDRGTYDNDSHHQIFTPLFFDLKVENTKEKSCRDVYWKVLEIVNQSLPESDPNYRIKYDKFDVDKLSKAILRFEDGTAFRIHPEGVFLTANHVIEEHCEIPKTNSKDLLLPCGKDWFVLSTSSINEMLLQGETESDIDSLGKRPNDFALVYWPSKKGKEFLRLSTTPIKDNERLFPAGYPADADNGSDIDYWKAYTIFPIHRNLHEQLLFTQLRLHNTNSYPAEIGSNIVQKRTGAPYLTTIHNDDDETFKLNRTDLDFSYFDGIMPSVISSLGPGMSGGPIFNHRGEVVGITTNLEMADTIAQALKILKICQGQISKHPIRQKLEKDICP